MRTATIKRKTKETEIEVSVNLDGTGAANIATGIGFFDHMLDLLARHSRIDLTVKAVGDLHIDYHHTTEDTGIALGQAVRQALGNMAGITRYAGVHMPMDETLSRVVIDISGRPFLVFKADFPRDKIGEFDTELVREWFQAFAINAGLSALGVGRGSIFVADLIVAFLLGLEGSSLRRWTLSRGKWRQLDVVIADDQDTAESRFFERWSQKQHGIVNDQWAIDRGGPPPTRGVPGQQFSNPPPIPAGGIIGLFPEPGGSR